MKLHQLRDFVAVASTGSLRAAARRLNLTQPSLTKSIGLLEKELGYSLFERHARGAVLSVAGRSFLPRAEAVLNELDRGVAELKHLGGTGGYVNMAVSAAVSLTALPGALKEFRKKFPDANVRVISAGYTVAFNELRAGAIDFCLGRRPSGALSEEFSVQHIFTNTRSVICRKDHPMRNSTSLSDLLDAGWLVSGATGLASDEHDQIFMSLGLPVPKSIVQCEYPTALVGLLAGTDMLSIMPRQYADAEVLGGLFVEIPIEEKLPGAEIVLIQKAGMPLTPAAEYMLTVLLRHIEYHRVLRSRAAAPST